MNLKNIGMYYMKIEEKTVCKYVIDGIEFDSYDDARKHVLSCAWTYR